MKRFLVTIQNETGLTRAELVIVLTIFITLAIGWLGNIMQSSQSTHTTVAVERVIDLLDSLAASTRAGSDSVVITLPSASTSRSSELGQHSRAPTTQTEPSNLFRRPVNLNKATPAQLDKLPGIGPALAGRIVAERAKAPFTSIDDLRRVKGIGAKKLEKLRPYAVAP